MARTTGKSGFKLRSGSGDSGNRTSFKAMGSSPMHKHPSDSDYFQSQKRNLNDRMHRDEAVNSSYTGMYDEDTFSQQDYGRHKDSYKKHPLYIETFDKDGDGTVDDKEGKDAWGHQQFRKELKKANVDKTYPTLTSTQRKMGFYEIQMPSGEYVVMNNEGMPHRKVGYSDEGTAWLNQTSQPEEPAKDVYDPNLNIDQKNEDKTLRENTEPIVEETPIAEETVVEEPVVEETEMNFGDAFKNARKEGLKEFEFEGKMFHTRQADETPEEWNEKFGGGDLNETPGARLGDQPTQNIDDAQGNMVESEEDLTGLLGSDSPQTQMNPDKLDGKMYGTNEQGDSLGPQSQMMEMPNEQRTSDDLESTTKDEMFDEDEDDVMGDE